ncbi:MAG: TIGR03435 family protein [Terracidiphilus sp.]
MFAQSLLPLLVLVAPFAFGQIGFYGPVTAHPHAGDLAPDLTFDKVLNSPGHASWSQSNLSGQLTVLVFFPNTSQNPEPVTLWNAIVNKFAGKPVQFVWITGEREATLQPFLEQHPIKGWVLDDPEGKTDNAYGMEMPANVIVGADRNIIGFFHGVHEIERLLQAIPEGRITTTRPSKENLKAFIESKLVLVDAEAPRMPRADDHRPAFPPSFTLHVSPSQSNGQGNFASGDFLVLQGYSIKDAIGFLYDFNPVRIQIPTSLDNSERYDFSSVLPEQESHEQIRDRMREGLQDYFHVDFRREDRLADVYVLTVAQAGKLPAVNPRVDGEGGGFEDSSVEYETQGSPDEAFAVTKAQPIGAIRGVSANGTVDVFCHTLESTLNRPVVNETNLQGEFVFRIEGSAGAENNFLERVREQLGLVITPAQRNVESLVLEPR